MATRTQKYRVPVQSGGVVEVHCAPQQGTKIIALMRESGEKFPDGNALIAFLSKATIPPNMRSTVAAPA